MFTAASCVQARASDAERLAALQGLTRLAYNSGADTGYETIRAIAQLTQLRRLRLWCNPSTVDDARLMHFSSLSRLTSLDLSGAQPCKVPFGHPMSW